MSESAHDYDANLLHQYDNWSIYLHENQSYLGRTYIALAREGEVDPFTDTSANEQTELLIVVKGLQIALQTLYQPDLLNYANLRNTWHHCHWHVVPRYAADRTVLDHTFRDPNWGKHYAPAPDVTLPLRVYEKVKTDLATELSTH